MYSENLKLIGIVTIEQYRNNQKIHAETVNNLITTRGKQILAERCFYAEVADYTSPDITSIKIGTDDTAAAPGQTGLIGSTLAKDIVQKKYNQNEMKYFTTFIDTQAETLGGATPATIREVGLFTDGDEMISRTVLTTPIIKEELDLLSIYWKLIIG